MWGLKDKDIQTYGSAHIGCIRWKRMGHFSQSTSTQRGLVQSPTQLQAINQKSADISEREAEGPAKWAKTLGMPALGHS